MVRQFRLVEMPNDVARCGFVCRCLAPTFRRRPISWTKDFVRWLIVDGSKAFRVPERDYFHYLIPEAAEEESSDGVWHGKLIALARTFKSEARENKKALEG